MRRGDPHADSAAESQRYCDHAMWCCRRSTHRRQRSIALLLVAVGTAVLHGVSTVHAKRDAHFVDEVTDTLAQANARIAAYLAELAIDDDADLSVHAVRGHELLFEAPCATAYMNMNEDWIAYRHEQTREIVYRKKDLSFAQDHPPCALFLLRIQDMKQREPTPYGAVVEIYDDNVGGYVAVETESERRALLRHGETIPLLHKFPEDAIWMGPPREVGVELITWRGDFLLECPFGFVSALDHLDGIARRSEYISPGDRFAAGVKTANLAERDPVEPKDPTNANATSLVTALLEQEQRVMASSSIAAFQETWHDYISLDEWTLLRREFAPEDVRALSRDWTQLAQEVLVAGRNATTGMNCLRRATNWDPGYIPAYLLMSSVLMQYEYQKGSCQVMETMLGNRETDDAQSPQMRNILTTHFSHCSVVLRVAHTWENHRAVLCVVGASVIVSFVHGIWILIKSW